jgi:glycosyltransferase involved in cell wall biosynthesis
MMLLDCYKRFLAGRCDLHIITESTLAPTAGVFVHRGLKPFTDPWLERWRRASLFVFPSHLETFGIVLLEALAFGVPVISSDVGAAREILRDGQAGWLMTDRNPESWGRAIRQVLDDPRQASGRVEEGRRQVAANYDLSRNAERLAERLLHAVH